jgi:hypothetical protein
MCSVRGLLPLLMDIAAVQKNSASLTSRGGTTDGKRPCGIASI